MAARRDVHPLLQLIRNYLLGRSYEKHLRFADEMAPRPGPQPVLPESSFVTISANQYHKRDARRKVAPPLDLTSDQKLIAKGSEAASKSVPSVSGAPLPGRPFAWTQV